MQAIIFIGIQATGKSTFYKANFFNSHIRISMDLLNTRNKENKFLSTCIATHSRFVVDNTNPIFADRKKYIDLAKENKYEVVGYYFYSSLNDALTRNNRRKGKARIPEVGVRGCYNKLQPPVISEGFDKLFLVEIEAGGFKISDWKNEV